MLQESHTALISVAAIPSCLGVFSLHASLGAELDLTGASVNMFSNPSSGGEDKSVGLYICVFDAGSSVVYVVCFVIAT